jgi:hypothetical protein
VGYRTAMRAHAVFTRWTGPHANAWRFCSPCERLADLTDGLRNAQLGQPRSNLEAVSGYNRAMVGSVGIGSLIDRDPAIRASRSPRVLSRQCRGDRSGFGSGGGVRRNGRS